MAKGTRLLLVRHGTTDANTKGLFLGHTDAALSEIGHREVALLGQRLAGHPVDVLVSSDLQRARHTADAIAAARADAIETRTDPRLKEMHLGDFEGVPATDVRARHPERMARWVDDPAHVRMPGADAETLSEVQARAWEAVSELVADHAGQQLVVVSHTFTLLTLLCRFLDLPIASFRRLHVDRASISEINWSRYGATLRRFNDTAHLKP